jgi:hypothetical protein
MALKARPSGAQDARRVRGRGGVLDGEDECAEHIGQRNSGQQQRVRRQVTAHARGAIREPDDEHRPGHADERPSDDAQQRVDAQHHRQHDAERGSARHAERERRRQRILQDRLQDNARGREARAAPESQQRTRQTQAREDELPVLAREVDGLAEERRQRRRHHGKREAAEKDPPRSP